MSNITLNSGTGGATLGTDTVTGTPNVDYQIVKLGIAAAATTPTLADGNSGNKSAGTLRVVLATDQPSLSNAIPASQSGTWNITNISGTISLPTGAAADSSVTGLQVAQGSTTSGQKGSLMLGAVTTGAPTYTTAQTDALSLDTAGNLRVNIAAGGISSGTAGSASTNVVTVQGIASMTKLLVTPDSVALPAHQSVNVDQLNGTTTDTNSGLKSAGTLRVVIATDQPSLSNALPASQSGTWTVQPGNTANTTPWLVTDTPGTSGGLSFSYTLSAASNNLTQAKGSAGQLFAVVVTNTNAAARYLKIFNKASASVTMGTTSADFQFVIPGNTAGAGLAINIDKGMALGTGITYAITAGVSLTDNTSVAANEVSALIGYK